MVGAPMGTYLALLLALGALATVLYYLFGPKGEVAEPPRKVAPPRPAMRGLIHVVARTDPGKKRQQNEDSLLVVEGQSLFVVADGMGGHSAGEVASQLAVETMAASFREGKMAPGDLPTEARLLLAATLEANHAVFAKSREVDQYRGMGTTVVAMHFSASNERAAILHAGDSRCYRMRGGTLKQLTVDHTLGAIGIKGSNAALLSRAVGIEENLEPEVQIEAPLPGDLYLLCSDGLSRMASDDQIEKALQSKSPLETRAQELIDAANNAGGRDNVTVILVVVEGRGA
jgi:protein phosphatase